MCMYMYSVYMGMFTHALHKHADLAIFADMYVYVPVCMPTYATLLNFELEGTDILLNVSLNLHVFV